MKYLTLNSQCYEIYPIIPSKCPSVTFGDNFNLIHGKSSYPTVLILRKQLLSCIVLIKSRADVWTGRNKEIILVDSISLCERQEI